MDLQTFERTTRIKTKKGLVLKEIKKMINKLLLFYTYFIVYSYNIFRQTSIQPSIQCKEEKYLLLRERYCLTRMSFFFSIQMLICFDLQDDKTDIKYAEMEFMQSIVGENRLIYESNNWKL